ncbi:MAG TPA: PLP-dependent aminotransferase family protein [Roseiflexaceae bacterium]|nr:PLP-dependent aminotransferase family protein [Roseiflexaceae bacterium]
MHPAAPTSAGEHVWEGRWSTGAGQIAGSAIRELLKLTEQPEFISFAGGLPAPECFPAEEIALAAERVLAGQAARALQYGPTEGFPPLRELLAALVARRGIAAQPSNVLVTSGSQQALDILGKLLIDPGAPVLVEDPTYVGALQAFRPYLPRFVSLTMDDEGLQPEALERALAELAARGEAPAFLYTVATFQNPTGVTLSAARRGTVLDIAARYGLRVVEDDPYGELRYSGEPVLPLAALDAQRHGGPRHVVYLSTFSKLLAPGMRVGWAVGPEALLRKMALAKQGLDLHTGSLAQAIAYETCRDSLLERQIPRIRRIYGERRAAMLRALEASMPPGVRWTRPEGGMFLWITLPAGVDGTAVLARAVERKVAFVPGASFHAGGGGTNTLRLNFSYAPPPRIEEGVRRLAEALA